jgi:hypothetical protein
LVSSPEFALILALLSARFWFPLLENYFSVFYQHSDVSLLCDLLICGVFTYSGLTWVFLYLLDMNVEKRKYFSPCHPPLPRSILFPAIFGMIVCF